MKTNNKMDFEGAFENFIEQREYDEAEDALFSMIRISFNAGWLAAGGKPPKQKKLLSLYRKQPNEILREAYINSGIAPVKKQ